MIRNLWYKNAVIYSLDLETFMDNLSHEPCEVRFRLPKDGGETLANLIDEQESTPDARGTDRILLDAYGYRWLRPGGLGYALHRTPE